MASDSASEPAPGRLEQLLAEATWLEGLARTLVRDRDEARDLVQEVWVAAAERGPARVERPRAWLAEVLRNALRSRRRAEGAREARERLRARHADVGGAGDVVARAEAQRLLVEHVLALDEPWRSTVLMRFFDGLASEEIARRAGVPASTVRNRLAHALALLREALERSRGTDWRAGLAALARGAPRGGTRPELGSGSMAIAGITKLALAGAALAALVWWSLDRERSGTLPLSATVDPANPSPAPPPERTRSALREPSLASTGTPPVAASMDVPATPSVAPAIPRGTLVLQVLDDGEPCPHGGMVELAPDWHPWMKYEHETPEGTRVRSLGSDGRARFEGLASGGHGLRVLAPGWPPLCRYAELPGAEGVLVVLETGSALVHGGVWDEEGRAVSGATVRLGDKSGTSIVYASTGDDGLYELLGLQEGPHWVTMWFPDVLDVPGEEVHSEIDVARGETRRLDFGSPEPLPHWRGTLRTKTGAEHRGGATLTLSGPGGMRKRSVEDGGRFDLRLEPGTYRIEAHLNSYDGFHATLGEVEVPPDDLERDLVLAGARVSGTVIDAVTGETWKPGERRLSISVRLVGHDYGAAVRSARVDAQGRFAIDELEPGIYLLNAWPLVVDGGDDSTRIELLPGQDELVLDVAVRARRPGD